MITLTLLHPVQGTAVQSWTFNQDTTVRIGRAVDNEVVLYSAVVSRHHVELRFEQGQWHVHNIGSNGTFLEGRKIQSEVLTDGQTIRLARSGPNIQVLISSGPSTSPQVSLDDDKARQTDPAESSSRFPRSTEIEAFPREIIEAEITSSSLNEPSKTLHNASRSEEVNSNPENELCTHERSPQSSLICIDCGEPLNVLTTIGSYKVLKSLGDRSTTFQGWKNKRTYILRTCPDSISKNPEKVQTFKQQLSVCVDLNHGGIPRMIEVHEHNNQPYLVYEMVYGINLENWVRDRGVLSVPLAISWITEIARILDYLHQLNPPFIHQGVKPSNIIRPTIPQGSHHLMLVNFGQTNSLLEPGQQEKTDLSFHSPHFKESITPQMDLYGLGATFLFMLTGSDPYKFMQLGDQDYTLDFRDVEVITPAIEAVIGGLLQTQKHEPITTASAAIDQFLHLM